MTNLIFTSSNTYIYLGLCITFLYFLIRYKQQINKKDLPSIFIYLTNKFNLLFLFFSFMFMFIFSIVDFSNVAIIDFFQSMIKGMLYFSFFNYGIFFGLALIPDVWSFIKSNDFFTFSFFGSGGFNK